MKFVMVVIICFGVDWQTIFDETRYENHSSCYDVALETSKFMQQMHPASSGQVHCFDEQQFSEFEKMLEQGGKIMNPDLLPDIGTAI